MKMPRSHCENENVQFVQELAEVDGPFESPININFRDLTKLELPSLVWNRAEVSPKKMKITNTGHTVIISGKWKCERPYLTGGPLSGKYVFSQIHFHWGQDDCKGSEHQVCGEGFPLEMHVAHFKTEYLTQECALREKDGMVVVVYLFKLQDEPNASLKKILNCFPNVQQASTSQALDPRPILSLCNPFTDDYFMYWGSVVTSTCAHILLWIISREPFGISREQVNEFRKILDTSHQPICRNSRDTQPLHRRNVFHVNASKHLDDPLLPIKKVLGCYCKGSETNVSSISATNDCRCQSYKQNQEDVEGTTVDFMKDYYSSSAGGKRGSCRKTSLPGNCFAQQSVFVQTAMIHSVPTFVKRFDSEPVGNNGCLDEMKQTKSEGDTQLNVVSKSCCFFSAKEAGRLKNRAEKRKVRDKKKPTNSVRAFSHLMDSLEAIKNQTFKKLKEIESINQEIKGMKPFCHDNEDRRWLRRIEKVILKQRRFTLKSSQGCFTELKKLAKECNFDKFFDAKPFEVGDNNQKMMWLNGGEVGNGALPYGQNCLKGEGIPRIDVISSKQVSLRKTIKFSAKAERLIQSFFEDIKESDELQETVKRSLSIKKMESLCSKQAGDSATTTTTATVSKGYITQKMFTLGNLGDRFFTAVSTDDFEIEENEWSAKKEEEEIIIVKQCSSEKIPDEAKKSVETDAAAAEDNAPAGLKAKTKESSPVSVDGVKPAREATESPRKEADEGKKDAEEANASDSLSSDSDELEEYFSLRESVKRLVRKQVSDLTNEKLMKELQARIANSKVARSSSNMSTESTEAERTLTARIHKRQLRREVWERRSSVLFRRISSKSLADKGCKKQKVKSVNLEGGNFVQKKSSKTRKSQRLDKLPGKKSCDASSTSREALNPVMSKSKWKRLTKVRFRLETENSSETSLSSAIEDSLISPERKKLKLEFKRVNAVKENKCQTESTNAWSKEAEIGGQTCDSVKSQQNEEGPAGEENSQVEPRRFLELDSVKSEHRTRIFRSHKVSESGDVSRASTHKTFRVSSADSRTSFEEKPDFQKSEESEASPPRKHELLKKETEALLSPKIAIKNWSLTNLTATPRFHSTEMNQRIFVESIDDRRQSSRVGFELKKKLDKLEERHKMMTVKQLCSEASRDADRKSGEERGQEAFASGSAENVKAMSEVEYDVRFFTTAAKQIDEELLAKAQLQEGKGKPAAGKGSDAKHLFPDAGPQEMSEDYRELPHRTDSNKSFTKGDSKDVELLFPPSEEPLSVDNKERQASVTFSAPKMTPPSRHHSAETLNSLKKTTKRKSKKRPHCVKRSSRHYIRKNSSIFRKPSKVESKQLPWLNLPDEEQLKIISANVAKYLKQKLVAENTELPAETNCSFKDIEEVVYSNLVAQQEKPAETPLQEKPTIEEPETIKTEPPVEKLKETTAKPEKKLEKKSETTIITAPNEVKKEKPAASEKPVHNFIKRNKQMAGKYKRSALLTDRNAEVKKEETKPKPETLKTKPKTPSKKKEKESPQKQRNQTKPSSEGASPQKAQNPSEKSKKGNPEKTPKIPIKPDSKNRKTRQKPKTPGRKAETKPESEQPKQGAEEAPEESLERAKGQPTEEPTEGPTEQPAEQPSEQPAEAPVEPPAEEPKEQPTELSAEEPTEQPTEPPAEQPVEEEPAQTSKRASESESESKPPTENKEPQQVVPQSETPRPAHQLPVGKIPQPKKRLIPAYMVTSYLPPPMEIVESQKRQMNKYLVSKSAVSMVDCLPEGLQETKSKKKDLMIDRKCEPVSEKELEYLIKLQMNLNEEITTNIEDSMTYVKTLLSPNRVRTCFDETHKKGMVLVEMKDLECSSSSSILTEDIGKCYLGRETHDSKSDSNEWEKRVALLKMPKEAGDPGVMNPIQFPEGPEDFNSDSSYDCKISITLNPNATEGEREITSHEMFPSLEENSNSQTTMYLDGSNSHSIITRTTRKKRKEKEFSMDMKKLLEILEGEIKREMAIANGRSSAVSSDGTTTKWEDSDGNTRTETESSCDMEMLTQISETMKQYLSDFKERRLEELITESSDKDSKDDESAS